MSFAMPNEPVIVTLDEVRAALDARGLLPLGAVNRRQFMAHCPCHEDRSPSLSVGEGASGSALIRCHAGCTHENGWEPVLRELGLWRESLRAGSQLRLVGDDGPLREERTPHPLPTSPSQLSALRGEDIEIGDETKLLARLWACGLPDKAGRIPCALPGHDGCSAVIDDGTYMCNGLKRPTALVNVFASIQSGRIRFGLDPFGPRPTPLAHRWQELLDYSAGLLMPWRIPTVGVPLSAPKSVRVTARRFELTLALREACGGFPIEHPITFARSWITDTTGISDDQARVATGALKNGGFIVEVGRLEGSPDGKTRGAVLWKVPT